MISHLWAEGSPPREWIELVLCRDVYHCRPSELAEENYVTVVKHLICLGTEVRVQEMRRG